MSRVNWKPFSTTVISFGRGAWSAVLSIAGAPTPEEEDPPVRRISRASAVERFGSCNFRGLPRRTTNQKCISCRTRLDTAWLHSSSFWAERQPNQHAARATATNTSCPPVRCSKFQSAHLWPTLSKTPGIASAVASADSRSEFLSTSWFLPLPSERHHRSP